MKFLKIFLILLGIILILTASFIEINFAPKYNPEIINTEINNSSNKADNEDTEDIMTYKFLLVVSSSLSALGISLVVGSLTSLLQKSNVAREEYLKDVEDIYERSIHPLIEDSLFAFITNPNTIKSLDFESRKQLAINSLMSDNQFDNYKTKIIHQIVNETSEFRMNGYIIGDVYIENDNVCLDATISYQKCKLNSLFLQELTFVDSDSTSNIEYVKFIDPNDSSNFEIVKPENNQKSLEKQSSPAFGSSFEYFNQSNIPSKFNNFNEINIEKKIKFIGFNHWINFGWMNSCPTFGFNVSINCKDDLKVKEYIIIDASNTYNVPPTDVHDRFDMSTTQWVSAYTGFVVTFGKDDTNSTTP